MSNNRLSKAAALVIAAVLCMLSVFVCSGADNSCTISEINDMKLTLPDDIITVTRSSKTDDKYFSLFGLDYNTTMNNLKNGNIYLQGMDSASSYTVTVTMTQTDDSRTIANYNLLQPDKLVEVSNNFLSQSEYSACTADSSDSIVWLYLAANVDSNGQKIKTYQANTVYDGKNINVIIQRNGGDVTPQDYATLNSIVSTVVFNKGDTTTYTILFIIIGATLFVILIIVLSVIISKRLKRKRRSRKNDKIIEELAGKYTSRRGSDSYNEEYDYSKESNYVDINSSDNVPDYEDDSADNLINLEKAEYDDTANEVSYSEEEIDEILGYKSRTSKIKPDVVNSAAVEAESVKSDNADNTAPESENQFEQDVQAAEDDISEEETEPETDDETDDEFDEYVNDEELVRQDAKQTKFNSSYDFFDEAPKKTMGVLSSDEIRDAEDYDVINEVEKRATEVEKSDSNTGKSFAEIMKNAGSAIKSFFVHCGYFITNVSRMIKHKRAVKKRKKAEEERRRRAKMRAQRQRQQRMEMENGGLVQVHKRNDGRPSGRSNSRPAGRPSSHSNRKPNSRPTNRPTNRR